MKKRWFPITALLTMLACFLPMAPMNHTVQARRYERIVICSDVHYGSKTLDPGLRTQKMKNKENAVREINGWDDVDLCIFTGDMVQKTGSPADYKLARKLTDRVKKPKEFLAGNHEVIYSSELSSTGRLRPADSYERIRHMEDYEKTFGPLYHSRKLGQYFLLFLSPDTLESKYAVELSKEQLDWLKKELKDHRQEPTLIFCHAPVTVDQRQGMLLLQQPIPFFLQIPALFLLTFPFPRCLSLVHDSFWPCPVLLPVLHLSRRHAFLFYPK